MTAADNALRSAMAADALNVIDRYEAVFLWAAAAREAEQWSEWYPHSLPDLLPPPASLLRAVSLQRLDFVPSSLGEEEFQDEDQGPPEQVQGQDPEGDEEE